MSLYKKLFCLHKWKTHAKSEKEHEFFTHGLSKAEFLPTGIKKAFVREILICECCGKIKQIDY